MTLFWKNPVKLGKTRQNPIKPVDRRKTCAKGRRRRRDVGGRRDADRMNDLSPRRRRLVTDEMDEGVVQPEMTSLLSHRRCSLTESTKYPREIKGDSEGFTLKSKPSESISHRFPRSARRFSEESFKGVFEGYSRGITRVLCHLLGRYLGEFFKRAFPSF